MTTKDDVERLHACQYLCDSLRGHLDDAGHPPDGDAHQKLAHMQRVLADTAAKLETFTGVAGQARDSTATAPSAPELDWLAGAQAFLEWNRSQAAPPGRVGQEHAVYEAALERAPPDGLGLVEGLRARAAAARGDRLLHDIASALNAAQALISKWRRYSEGNFDDAANARSRCADDLEAVLGKSSTHTRTDP